MPHRKTSLLYAAGAAILVMSITASEGPFTLFWTNQTRVERNLVEDRLDNIRTVQSLLVDAETGQRGYVLTGKELFLQPYYIAESQLPLAIRTLRLSYQDAPEEAIRLNGLTEHAALKMSHLNKVVKLRREEGFDVSAEEISTGHGKQLMDKVRDISADLIFEGTQKVAMLDDQLHANLRWAVAISVASFLLTLTLGRFIYKSMRSTVLRQTESAAAAIDMSAKLSQSMKRLEQRNREIGLLAEMARLLQTELSQEETLQLASTYCHKLLTASTGTFFLYRNSADVLQRAAGWGQENEPQEMMTPKDCWAIRRGRWHIAEGRHDLHCNHYTTEDEISEAVHWCLPLMAYGEVLGLLHIRQAALGDMSAANLQFVEAIAEQTALALANGRMRQVLQTQSIRDPLTSLYNRRFMEETLERELARARRGSTCLSVIMLDLDNFKALNDRHGHPAGDAVLRATSALLLRSLRASDIACRFGGEELMIILPDCSLEDAVTRAETIRDALEAMSVTELGQSLHVTGSFGVACTTLCGVDQGALLKAADSELYKAKRAGKNRVEPKLISA